VDEISTRVLDLLTQSIGSTDAGLRCRYANRAYGALLGRSPESMLGLHIRELWGDKLYAEALPYLTRALAGEAVSFSKRASFPNGEHRHGRIDLLPEPDGGYMVVMRGLDEAERMAKERDRLIHELDHRANNTFQVLQSVLALELRAADDPTTTVLEAIKARVDALALSYEFMRTSQPHQGWPAELMLERVASCIGPGDTTSWTAEAGLRVPANLTETFIFIAMELARWASMNGERARIEARSLPLGLELSAEGSGGVDLTTRAGATGLALVESFAERCGAGPLRGARRLSLIFPLPGPKAAQASEGPELPAG
jgi:two-component sensor histidine kinase